MSHYSRLVLPKKLQPAKRAWKSFSNTLQSKLHNLKYAPKAIRATIQGLISTLHSLCNFTIHSKASSSSLSHHKQVHCQNLDPMGIIINDQFADEAASSSCVLKYDVQGKTSRDERSGIVDVEEAWKAVVARSPVLRVDERAEEFISKFREDMKLQTERSLREFQERLARSA